MTDFGTRLKHARKLKKLTQKELAIQLGVEQSAISNYETNFRVPATSALMAIADHLDVSIASLLGKEDPATTETSSETSLEASDFFSNPLDKSFLQNLRNDFLDDLLNRRYTEAYDRIKNTSDAQIGVLELYQHVFEPVLITVGTLWETGKMTIAEEHIISDLIDRALVMVGERSSSETTLLKPYAAAFMLPGSEMHQFPLKITAEIFKTEGWGTYYIGKSIPVYSLEQFLKDNKIDVLVLSVTLKEHLNSCEALIHSIKGMHLPHRPTVLVGGSAISDEKIALEDLGADRYLKSLHALKIDISILEQKTEV